MAQKTGSPADSANAAAENSTGFPVDSTAAAIEAMARANKMASDRMMTIGVEGVRQWAGVAEAYLKAGAEAYNAANEWFANSGVIQTRAANEAIAKLKRSTQVG